MNRKAVTIPAGCVRGEIAATGAPQHQLRPLSWLSLFRRAENSWILCHDGFIIINMNYNMCMYVYIYIICLCMYVRTYVCMYVGMYVCM